MTTNDNFLNVTSKRLLGVEDFGERFLDYLRNSVLDLSKNLFAIDIVFEASLALTDDGNDTISLVGSSIATDANGHLLDCANSYQGQVAAFENESAIVYYVGLHYCEIPNAVQINPRTGLPEYAEFFEDTGLSGTPGSVVDNGNDTITFNVNSVLESGVDHKNRYVTVYKVTPDTDAITDAIAIETVLVAYNAPNNTITTTGSLGQSTISTTASDYVVVLRGPIVSRGTNLETEANYVFIGKVTGSGAGTTPTVFDYSDQRVLPSSWVSYLFAGFETDLFPATDSTYSLGTSSLKWLNIYTDNLLVNSDFLPVNDGTQDLGDPTHQWADLYLSGEVKANTIDVQTDSAATGVDAVTVVAGEGTAGNGGVGVTITGGVGSVDGGIGGDFTGGAGTSGSGGIGGSFEGGQSNTGVAGSIGVKGVGGDGDSATGGTGGVFYGGDADLASDGGKGVEIYSVDSLHLPGTGAYIKAGDRLTGGTGMAGDGLFCSAGDSKGASDAGDGGVGGYFYGGVAEGTGGGGVGLYVSGGNSAKGAPGIGLQVSGGDGTTINATTGGKGAIIRGGESYTGSGDPGGIGLEVTGGEGDTLGGNGTVATGGVGDTLGGNGTVATGGVGDTGNGGIGIEATGGSSNAANGGLGASFTGGAPGPTNTGGAGLLVQGANVATVGGYAGNGATINSGDLSDGSNTHNGGVGLQVYGGTVAGSGLGGTSIYTTGGNTAGVLGGRGIFATGGNASDSLGVGGRGGEFTGGNASAGNGTGGDGVKGVGGIGTASGIGGNGGKFEGGTGSAAINLVPASDPSSPNNGDIWATSTALKCRINGVTYTLAP